MVWFYVAFCKWLSRAKAAKKGIQLFSRHQSISFQVNMILIKIFLIKLELFTIKKSQIYTHLAIYGWWDRIKNDYGGCSMFNENHYCEDGL